MLNVRLLFGFWQQLYWPLFGRLRPAKFFLGGCLFLLVTGLITGDVDAQLQNGLVGYWSLNEGSGTAAMDSSGNGNTGILFNGPTWSSGKSGLALAFDGNNDYVEIPHAQSLNLSTALTVSVWINNETLMDPGLSQDQYRIIASKGWPIDGGSWSLAWRANDGSLFFFVGRNTSYRYASFAYDNSQAGTWHLITAVLGNGTISLYQDGVLKAGPVGIDSSSILTNTSPLRVGSLGASSSSLRNWDGLLDELRLYNRALSAAEIVSLYQQDNQSFNFSLANSMSLSATQGSSATNTITASLVSGSPQPVSFSISGLPSGASGSFSQTTCNATCSSLLTIATAASTPTGTYTITVTGKGGDVTKTTSFTLTVNSSTGTGTFNFSLSNDGNKSVTQGQSIASTITATLSSGSSQAISFSTAGLPTGATAAYSTSTSCSPTCSRTLNIATTTSTPVGTYTITVTGAGGVTRTTTFSLTVSSSTVATPTITPNGGSFTGSVSVTLQTATSGASIFYTTDGSTPTQSSTLYTEAFTLTSNAVVKAIAFKNGSSPSAQASASFTIAAPSAAQLTLTWQDNSTNENNFAIERKTGTSGTYAQIAMVAANIASYVDTSVTRGVTYCYRVQAVNSAGASAYTNEACAPVP